MTSGRVTIIMGLMDTMRPEVMDVTERHGGHIVGSGSSIDVPYPNLDPLIVDLVGLGYKLERVADDPNWPVYYVAEKGK